MIMMAGNFCENKLLLKAEEVGFVDLILVLFSSNLENIKCIEKTQQNEEKWRAFRRRWIIFVSLLAQKLLTFMAKPMTKFGNFMELVLNLSSFNGGGGGVFKLLFTFLKDGKVVWPDRSSENYTSMLGCLDKRLDLDFNPQNHNNYAAFISLMTAKLSYENPNFIHNVVENRWKMDFLGFFSCWNDYSGRPTTQAFIAHDTKSNPNLIVVAFRGTSPFDAHAWATDVDISWYEFQGVGKIHGGFMKALGMQKNAGWPNKISNQQDDHHQYAYYTIREKLKDILANNENSKLIVCGHSLGGALAVLFAALLVIHEEKWLLEKLQGVYTFGQPRVGNHEFGDFIKEKFRVYHVKYLRFVYNNDMVPRLPYDDKTLLFKHFGPCIFFDSFYKSKVLPEEPNRNYFSPIWALPKMLNAVWEMMRSFIIPYTQGGEYQENLLMKMFRMVGLLIPGLTAHSLQDYDNSTRLGCLPSNSQLEDSSMCKSFTETNTKQVHQLQEIE